MPDNYIKTFVDAAISHLRQNDRMRFPGGPPSEMVDASIAPEGSWVGWRPIASTVLTDELNLLEFQTKLAFPPAYRELLLYQHFIELTSIGVRFNQHLPHKWKDVLIQKYFHSWPREKVIDIGLLPFGEEAFMDAGPVCFDTRQRLPDGDCPVVFWDHEWVGSRNEVQQIFSSSRKMFECLSFAAASNLNFVYHDEDDDAALLPQKKALLAEFLAIDPTGAGGVARKYWSSWGVTPAG